MEIFSTRFSNSIIEKVAKQIGTRVAKNYLESRNQLIKGLKSGNTEEIKQAMQVLKARAQSRQVQLKIDSRLDKPVTILGSSIKFNLIIVNLIANAIDSYEEKSATCSFKKKQVIVFVSQINHSLCLKIQDFGGGISSRAQPFIFQPFFSTKHHSSSHYH